MTINKKIRLDAFMVNRQLAPSRDKAAAIIMAGEVLLAGQVVYKPDTRVSPDCQIEIKKRYPYVSRGAFKIEKALKDFQITCKGLKVIDIGISTGGFSDFLLKNGAELVTGVDVNIDQVDFNLKKNNRLKLLEKNARFLEYDDIGYQPDLITIDVSFISITKIIPVLKVFKTAKILCLVKPQFEASRRNFLKKGIVKDRQKRIDILLDTKNKLEELNYSLLAFTEAGIKGRRGNREYFFLLVYGKRGSVSDTIITNANEI